jgi:hypothetical protein
MPVSISANRRHHPRPKTAVEVKAQHRAKPTALAQPLTSALQLLANNQPHLVEHCSTLAHFLLDVDLGVHDLSEKDLTALRHLSQMMRRKVEEYEALAS